MPASRSLITRMLVQTAIWLSLTGALLFISAGTLDWPQAWIYLAELGGLGLASGLALSKSDPDLVRERMKGLVQRDQKPAISQVDTAFENEIGAAARVTSQWSYATISIRRYASLD